jgi:type IV pilus assembly protein PilA
MKLVPTMIALAALVVACKRECPTDTGKAAATPSVTSPAIDTLIAGVPGNALALGFLDLDRAPWQLISMGLDDATRASLDKELREYIGRYIGADLSKVQYAVMFVSGPPPMGAVLIKSVSGTLTLPGAADVDGAKLWVVDPNQGISLAMKGDTIVLGLDPAVRAVLETLAQKRKNIVAANKALVDWLKKETPGAVIGFAGIMPKGLPLPPEVAGLQRVAASLGRNGVRAAIEGDDATISGLQGLADQALAEMLSEANRARDAAIKGDLPAPEGAGAIISAAYAKSYAAKLKPKREGNRLSGAFELPFVGGGAEETMTVVAIVGILAAIAVPAFMDYMKHSKKTESALQLNKLGKNLKVYHTVKESFPVGETPLTPATSCCTGPTFKCTTTPADWDNPLWKELDFQIDEPHLFQYRYQSDGKTAHAEAIGDLDCDGVAITYKLEAAATNGDAQVMLFEPPPNSD